MGIERDLIDSLDLLKRHFPLEDYYIVFRQTKEGWQFVVKGDPSGHSKVIGQTVYCLVDGKDFAAIPAALLKAVTPAIERRVAEAATQLIRARNDLEAAEQEHARRLRILSDAECLLEPSAKQPAQGEGE